ncbi:MAG: hypothetical protein JSV86_10570 [Gemmatimonadota bacterium]|nr:MAG: hypothetical protein JSV86_10570 [Gemmatimonadota bacterium]
MAPTHGFVAIDRPRAYEIIHRDCLEGDHFTVIDGVLRHNGVYVCDFSDEDSASFVQMDSDWVE